jgi:hypothetical protein
VSSAILFAAIVAIWAGALVPRWVRKPHGVSEPDHVMAADAPDDAGSDSAEPPERPGADPAARGGWNDASQGDLDTAGADSPGGSLDPADDCDDHSGLNRPRVDLAAAAADPPSNPYRGAPEADLPGSAIARPRRTGRAARPTPPWSTSRRPAPAAPATPHAPHAAGGDAPPLVPVGQPAVIRTRRRLLALLALLTGGMAASAATGVGRWWMVAPAAGLLAGYLMLLREAGRADAEAAQFRALARAEEAAARRAREAVTARQMEGQEHLASVQRTAEVIDISARVSDQFYDQYADVADRAVGD